MSYVKYSPPVLTSKEDLLRTISGKAFEEDAGGMEEAKK